MSAKPITAGHLYLVRGRGFKAHIKATDSCDAIMQVLATLGSKTC
jgi:hypothetical protein